MQAARGTKSLRNVWARENIQEPPYDCVEERSSGAYIKSAWQVLQEHHQEHQGAISQKYMDAQQDRIEELKEAFDNDYSTLDPPDDLACWAKELEEGEVDSFVAGEFGHLASKDEMGKAEATRILHHLMKPGEEFTKGPSRWLHKAISESMEYLNNWACWESKDPHIGASRIEGNKRDPRAPREHQYPQGKWETRDVPVPQGADNPWTDFKHTGLVRDPHDPKPSSSSMYQQHQQYQGPPPPPPDGSWSASSPAPPGPPSKAPPAKAPPGFENITPKAPPQGCHIWPKAPPGGMGASSSSGGWAP